MKFKRKLVVVPLTPILREQSGISARLIAHSGEVDIHLQVDREQMAKSRSRWHASSERRDHVRFALQFRMRLIVFDGQEVVFSGEGNSVNISSSGLLLWTAINLTVGDKVIAALEWPVTAEAGRMALIVYGHVVWRSGFNAGVLATRSCIVPCQEIGDFSPEVLSNDFLPRQLMALKKKYLAADATGQAGYSVSLPDDKAS